MDKQVAKVLAGVLLERIDVLANGATCGAVTNLAAYHYSMAYPDCVGYEDAVFARDMRQAYQDVTGAKLHILGFKDMPGWLDCTPEEKYLRRLKALRDFINFLEAYADGDVPVL